MNKHAYLIMAHNNFEILEKTLKLLDDEKNDFYIHIDKKVKNFDFDTKKNTVKKSKIFFTERTNVKWGHFSQIQCELILLKKAISNNYSYYHLISGVDMPIKSKDEIYNFFENNQGKEFITFQDKVYNKKFNNRFNVYHLFPYYSRSKFKIFLYPIEKLSLFLQKLLKIDRIKKSNIQFQKGANWFSITNGFAKYILKNEKWIRDTFKFSSCCDEIFLQTLIVNSQYNSYIYISLDEYGNYVYDSKRYIDWNRGTPYTFRKEDFNSLISSKDLFARKFDLNIDREIIELIFNHFVKY